MPQELILVAIIAIPFACYLFGVWVASEVDRRAFGCLVDQFDDVTRDHRARTPRVRMTLYQKLIDRTIRRRKREVPPPASEPEALRRRHVFLNLRSPIEDGAYESRDLHFKSLVDQDDGKTLRMAADEEITLRMQ